MEIKSALVALGALAQETRLGVFRVLVEAGPTGLSVGEIAASVKSSPATLSFHLKELAYSGLVSSEARGRNLIYRANFGQMTALLGYLTEHCCQGQACEVSAEAACINC